MESQHYAPSSILILNIRRVWLLSHLFSKDCSGQTVQFWFRNIGYRASGNKLMVCQKGDLQRTMRLWTPFFGWVMLNSWLTINYLWTVCCWVQLCLTFFSVVLYLVSSIKELCIDPVKTMMANSIHQEALHVILQKLHSTLTSWETMAAAETEQDNKSLLLKLTVKLIFLIFRNSEAVVLAFEILVKALKGDFLLFFFPL